MKRNEPQAGTEEEVVVVTNGNGVHQLETAPAEDAPSGPDFSEKLAQVSDKIVLGAHKAQEKIVDFGHKVKEKAGEAKVQIGEFGEQAFDQAKYFGGEVGVQARTHPLLLLGVAVAAGALIARIGR